MITETREYLRSLFNEVFEDYIDRRQQVLDVFLEFYSEDRIWIPMPNESYIEALYRWFVGQIQNNLPDYVKQINKPLEEYSVESLKSWNIEHIINSRKDNLREDSLYVKTIESCIIIYYPKVTVENEYYFKHIIYDTYVKVVLKHYRITAFYINRATYTAEEIAVGYVHSHTPSRNLRTEYPIYSRVCLGTGPISNTIDSLNSRNFDIDLVGLFCQELDNYLQVESLTGGPYIRMFTISNKQSISYVAYSPTAEEWAIKYTKLIATEILKANVLTFVYHSGMWCISNNFVDSMLKVSQVISTIENDTVKSFYESNCQRAIVNGIELQLITEDSITSNTISKIKGKPALVFKDKDIPLKILEENSNNDNFVYVLHPKIVEYFLYYITFKLNQYGYSKYDS